MGKLHRECTDLTTMECDLIFWLGKTVSYSSKRRFCGFHSD